MTDKNKIQSIAVYCGSSDKCKDIYKQAAEDFGAILAKNKIEMVYGGGRRGLMGITAKSCMDHGGKVCGIRPHFLDNHEGKYEEITELHYVDSMHERKQMMFERADAFAILPGGFGTLDELFEILTWKQIGLHKKYVFILDINRYWAPIFLTAIEGMVEAGFIRKDDKNLFSLIERVEDIVPFFSAAKPENQAGYVAKWG